MLTTITQDIHFSLCLLYKVYVRNFFKLSRKKDIKMPVLTSTSWKVCGEVTIKMLQRTNLFLFIIPDSLQEVISSTFISFLSYFSWFKLLLCGDKLQIQSWEGRQKQDFLLLPLCPRGNSCSWSHRSCYRKS